MEKRRPGTDVVWLAGLVVALLVLGRFGVQRVVAHGHEPAFSPASGLAAGALVLATRRRWLVVLLVFVTSLSVRTSIGDPVVVGALCAAGNAGEAALFALLVERVWPRIRRLDGRLAVVQFLGAALLAASLGALATVVAVGVTGARSLPLGSLWAVHTGAHTLGILAVAPIVLLGTQLRRIGSRSAVELVVFATIVAVVGRAGFDPQLPIAFPYVAVATLLFMVAWIGTPGAAVLPLVLVPLSIARTMAGHGPFAQLAGASQPILAVELYGLTAVAGAWLIAGLLAERAAALGTLESTNRDLDARVRERTVELDHLARHAQLAADVANALDQARFDEQTTMQRVAGQVARALDGICIIGLLAPDGRTVEMPVVYTPDRRLQARVAGTLSALRLDAGPRSLAGRAIRASRTVRAGGTPEELAARAHPSGRELILRCGLRQIAVAPMHGDGAAMGTIAVARAADEPFDDLEAELLQDVADRAGLAFTNARLYGVLARRARHAQLAADVSHALGEAKLDEQLAMDDIAARLADALGDACVVMHLVEDGSLLAPMAVRADDPSVEQQLRDAFAPVRFGATVAGLAGRAIASGTVVRATGGPEALAAVSHPALRDEFLASGMHSAAVAPMHSDGQIVGAVAMLRNHTMCEFDDTETALLQDLADRSGLALSNAQLHGALAAQALRDPLTGLANRDLMLDHLGLALDGLQRSSDAVALLYVDLDRFKDVNDSLGHDAGDEVLTQVGARLTASVRAPDTAARIGGDEFVVVCPGVGDADNAARIADRLESALSEPIRVGSADIDVGASIGVTLTRSSTAEPEALIRQADQAMYEAKKRGRRRWQMYDGNVRERAVERLAVEQDLRRALHEQWLRLHYQPIVDLRTGHVTGVEALLRIDHPERGLLLPGSFIDVAEESDLIVPIGEWVIREACAQLARWHEFPELEMAINVAGRHVATGALGADVLAAASTAGVDPSRVTLEMTERVLIDMSDRNLDDLRRLTTHGVRLALDDFGTGYSSLTYLKNLPVDIVKIDRSFIAELGMCDLDTAIVEAIIGLTRTLGLASVAEGVEDESQRVLLSGLGCDAAQGYHFARPVAPDGIEELLHRARASERDACTMTTA